MELEGKFRPKELYVYVCVVNYRGIASERCLELVIRFPPCMLVELVVRVIRGCYENLESVE